MKEIYYVFFPLTSDFRITFQNSFQIKSIKIRPQMAKITPALHSPLPWALISANFFSCTVYAPAGRNISLISNQTNELVAKNRDWRPVNEFFEKIRTPSCRGEHDFFRHQSMRAKLRVNDGYFFGLQLYALHTFLVLSCSSFNAGRGRQSLKIWEEKMLEFDSKSRSSASEKFRLKFEVEREYRLQQ